MPESSGDQGTKRAIIAAFVANFCIAIAKFLVSLRYCNAKSVGVVSGLSVELL